MFRLTGYKIKEQISRGSNSIVLRGVRESDNRPVVIKLLAKDYPSAKEITDFIHEYQIMGKIDSDCIIKPYTILKGNRYAIIMEDIEGQPLAKALKHVKLGIDEIILLAIKMAHCLDQLHKHNIIHKDINPTNFIWNQKTNEVRLIDFGISTEATREAPHFASLDYLECTLAYISPEQTGRVSRPIDCRTDLYSLGVTFYEMFAGKRPFRGVDKSELIFSHIAKTPLPPHEVNPDVPVFLSEIIMKLMSKAVEERYQSAIGLKKDLEFCLQNFGSLKLGYISFVPGQGDVNDRFEVPRRLYGRETEIETLLSSFEISSDGGSEFLLVSGHSGIGKSSLIHEIYTPITARKGYFISGKFSQFMQSIPYYGISQAFKELIKQLLTQSQERLDSLKQDLLDALGSNAQLVIDIIPELEKIIGPQPPISELNPLEAQNRLKITFREFFKVFTGPGQPLVIFLDDLQWSDTSTLHLIEYILEAGEIPHVFIIGAYRDNESGAIKPLLRRLEKLGAARDDSPSSFKQISLKPLDFSAINQLVADTLRTSLEEAGPLSKIIEKKTSGNPFFIRQMLSSLYLREAITFLPEKGRWIYDLQKVEGAVISDNVVDLLVKGLKSLPEKTKKLLSLGSCIGNQFDLRTISSLSKLPTEGLVGALWSAIEKEIILPLDSNYRYINTLKNEIFLSNLEMRFCFAHDRIRQAVYSDIPENEKSMLHRSIGHRLLKAFRETGRTDMIFDLVNHLNKGRALIVDRDERVELADLNIIAGQKAMKSTAFTTALGYFDSAMAALSKAEWADTPCKLFCISLERASAATLSGDLQKAEALCEFLAEIADGKTQKCAVSSVKVLLFIFQGRLYDTIDEVRKALRLLGIYLPENAEEIEQKTQEGIKKIQQFIAHTPVEEIVSFPVMTDPEKIMAMQLLFQVNPPAIQVSPKLFNLSTIMMFELTLDYGTSPLSCKSIADCGVILGTVFSDYKTGYKLGEVAFALISKFNAQSQKPPVYFIFSFLSPWVRHFQEAVDYYDMSYRAGIKTGDLMHATYALAHKAHLLMWTGKNLSECREETERSLAFIRQVKGPAPLLLGEIVLYFIDKLQTIPAQGENPDFEEQNMIANIESAQNIVFLGRFYQYNTYVNFILGNIEEAERWSALAEKLLFALKTDFPVPDHHLFKGLILIHKWKKASASERSRVKFVLDEILKKLKNWAENCPENFEHKYYLLSAQVAIIKNSPLESIARLFQKTTDCIGGNDFMQFRALSHELCGKFWLERGNHIVGQAYIREAYYFYGKWGADRKLTLMDKEFGAFITWTAATSDSRTLTAAASLMDMNSIIKSTQAISGEIKIEKLLTILMGILIENAGAQRGCILLKDEFDGKFYIEASKDLENQPSQVVRSLPPSECKNLCLEIVQYVIRSRDALIIRDALSDSLWQGNSYIRDNGIRSVMCLPILYQNRLKGIVYLENNLSDSVLSSDRLETIRILSSQAAISIENARLYEKMEDKVRERTFQLNVANERLRELSLRDSLTGLYNRRYLNSVVSEKVSLYLKKYAQSRSDPGRRISAPADPVGVFLLDIDYFKEVNDTYGHTVGDNVLVTISNVLKQMLSKDDVLVRWGGEEFLIILFDKSSGKYCQFARQVVETIENTPATLSDNRVIYKTCSLGYCEIPLNADAADHTNLEEAIRISDYALYCAKEKGRNCSARFTLNKNIGTPAELKNHLATLSRSADFNKDFFEIEYL